MRNKNRKPVSRPRRGFSAAVFVIAAIVMLGSGRALASLSITNYAGFVDYTSLVYILEKSDSYYWEHNLPSNVSTYDETDYSEFKTFGFMSYSPSSVSLQVRWCYNTTDAPEGVKVEVWEEDTATWHSETGITISTSSCSTTQTRTLSYIDTANDITNIKLRILGYQSSSTNTTLQLNQFRINAVFFGFLSYTYSPTEGNSTNVLSLRTSDNVRMAYAADLLTSVNESVYQEYSNFGFAFPSGAEMGATTITYEWLWDDLGKTASMRSAKLEIWDESSGTWNDSTLSLPSKLSDSTATVNAVSYANTGDDLNNIKVRFLGAASRSSSVGVRQDLVKIVAKRKILASDIAVYAPVTKDFYPNSTGQVLLSFSVPDNDGVADTLTGMIVKNNGTAVYSNELTNMKVCLDNSPYASYGTEDLCTTMTYSSSTSRWSVSGMSRAIAVGGARVIIVGDIASLPVDGRTVQMQIVQNGITVSSGYNGPTDAAVTNPDIQTINGMVASQITNTGATALTVLPATTNNLAMDFTIPTNGGTADTLTGIRVMNTGTAVNSTDIATVKVWAESGTTAGFQSTSDTLLGTLTWNSTNSWWANTSLSLAYSAAKRLYVTVDIAAKPTDAATVIMQLPAGGLDSTAGVVVASGNDGPLDTAVTNANALTINGMIASEITNTGAPTAYFSANETNDLVMNFVVPANGATADTLNGIRVQNTGTAVRTTDISAVKIWADRNGNGTFEPTGSDSPALGTATWNTSGYWELTGLTQTISTSGQRIFVSVDIASTPTVNSTIKMQLKTGSTDTAAGVVMASGNDGPLDAVVLNANTQTIRTKLTVAGTDKAGSPLELSSTNNTIEQLTLTVGAGTVALTTLAVTLTGTAVTSDITAVKLWQDVNGNGAWDAGDTQLSTTKTFSGGTLTFSSFSLSVTSGTPKYLIVTYDISASATMGHTAGLSIASVGVAATPSGSVIIYFPTDPIVSSTPLIGRTLMVTGTDKQQLGFEKGSSYVIEQLTLTASSGTINISALKIDLTGSGSASDLTAVNLYHDVNNNGLYDSGTDVLLDTKTFSGATLTFSPGFSVTTGTPENLLIQYAISSSATIGATLGMSMADTSYITTGAGENKVFTNTIQSTNGAVNPSLLVAGADKAPASVAPGQQNVVMLQLTLTATSDAITVTSIKTALTGTSSASYISSVNLYHDANDNGTYESGTDVLLSSKTFSGTTATFSALTFNVAYGTPERLLIVYNVASSASVGYTMGARLADSSYITVNTPPVVAAFSAIQSTNSVISTAINVVPTDSAASLPDGVTKGQTNALFVKLSMKATVGSASITALKVKRTGTGADSDITGAKLYYDQNANGTFESATDQQIGSTMTFSGGSLTFSGFTVTPSTTASSTIFVVYNISSSATLNATLGAEITDVSYFTTNPTTGVTVNLTTAPFTTTTATIHNAASLTASFASVQTPENINDNFTVTLTVVNAANSSRVTTTAPSPSTLTKTYGSGAAVVLVNGPTPASASIEGGAQQNFVYTFYGSAAGTVTFSAVASGTDANLLTTVTSSTATSNTVTINTQISPSWTFSDSGSTQAFYGSGAPATNPSSVKVVYIGNENKNLYSVKLLDGTKVWSYTATNAIRSTPYVKSYVIYFGDEGGYFYAVRDNGSTASQVWKVSAGTSAIRTGATRWLNGTEGRIYFGSLNGYVYCLNESTGAKCSGWSNPSLGSAIYSTPALPGDGYLYVGTYGGSIYKIDRSTGSITTTYTGYTSITAAPFVYPKNISTPANGSWLWIGSQNKNTYKIDTTKTNGSQNTWTFGPTTPVPVGVVQNSVFVDAYRTGVTASNDVFVGNSNGCLYAITDSGVQKWKYPAGSSTLTAAISSCPVLDPNTDKVYFGAEDNKLYAVSNGSTAATLLTGWPYQTAGAVKACPSMSTSPSYVLFPSTDGKVYAFPR